MAKQVALFSLAEFSFPQGFGGALLGGRRKTQRPLSSRETIHMVLRADIDKGPKLLRHRREIERRIQKYSAVFGVRIYRQAICKDHIHFLLRLTNRKLYRGFVRALTGQLSQRLRIKWQLRPWSRVVTWGRAFDGVKNYVFRNILEAAGVIPYQPRAHCRARKRPQKPKIEPLQI